MAFGAGVLISALSFELMDAAYRRGGFLSTGTGFLVGAGAYTVANWLLARHEPSTASGRRRGSDDRRVRDGPRLPAAFLLAKVEGG